MDVKSSHNEYSRSHVYSIFSFQNICRLHTFLETVETFCEIFGEKDTTKYLIEKLGCLKIFIYNRKQ